MKEKDSTSAYQLAINRQESVLFDDTDKDAEEDRVDTDEMYPTLALTLRLLGRWHEALEVLAEGWQRINLREDAIRKGIKIWHMHALEPSIEQVSEKRTD